MIRTTISEVKNSLSAYLRRVKRGETVLIMDRKIPVARLVPVAGSSDRLEEGAGAGGTSETVEMEEQAKLARLESSGIVVRQAPGNPREIIRQWRPLYAARLVAAVLEERRGGPGDGVRDGPE